MMTRLLSHLPLRGLTAQEGWSQSSENISWLGDPPPITQPCTINVILFGETGVGKSSVINLIAQKNVAEVSSNVDGCTMHSTRYDISFDDMNFAIFDTIGLEEPQMGVNGYLKAIEKAYELIVKLNTAGGVHLLVFCLRGGRITATTQSNYRLFCECLCGTKVPMALVFTGLEMEAEMEEWWRRNKTHIEHYGIKSDDHACITAVQGDTPGEDLKYTESRKRIRELLKTCALKNEAFLPEPHSWFAKFLRDTKSFIEKQRNPKRRDVMKVLTNRCKLDPETARKIADMMEKGDTDENPDEQVGNTEDGGRSNPEVRADGKGVREVPKVIAAKDDAKDEPRASTPSQRDQRKPAKMKKTKHNTKAEPRTSTTAKKNQRTVARKNTAKDDAEAVPGVDGGEDGGQHKYGSGGDHALDTGAAEQVKQGDTREKPVSLVSSPLRQVTGSQS